MHLKLTIGALACVALGLSACGGASDAATDSGLRGTIQIHGSSTVYPISEAVAEEFMKEYPTVSVTVGVSGTGGGFKKFVRNETDINDASRPIQKSEVELAKTNGVEFIELAVAYDGIAIVAHKDNDFLTEISVAQLNKIWQPGSTVHKWSDVEPSWPDQPIKLFGADVDSGTFDYFTEVVNGKEKVCRDDYTASSDDHVIVQGVSGEKNSLGFFGFAYYVANKDKLKLINVVGPNGSIAPSHDTIADGTYAPMSRPLFIYVRRAALDQPHIAKFVEYYIDNARELAEDASYVALPENVIQLVRKRLDNRTTGTLYSAGHQLNLIEALSAESR